jgi:SAM-dependent methyltransferase
MPTPDTPNLFTDGKAYERLMGRWSKLAGAKFLDWLNPPKNLRWIDVGCGNGAFTEVLIARSSPAAVTGVDPSEGQLAFARTRPGTKTAQFRQADAQALPFPDKSFDAASMALVITFIPDPVKAASEMARVVKPGGIVATYMWDFTGDDGFPLMPIYIAMKSLGMPAPEPPHVDASRRDTMQAIWQQAGLQAVATEVIRITVSYADFDDFWDSTSAPVGTSGKAISELSPAAREALKARLREQLPIAADGRISYGAFANAVQGRSPA